MAFHFRQNSMFQFTLNFAQSILHFVLICHLSLHSRFNFFAFNIRLWFMQHSSFRFRHSTFHKQQSSFRIFWHSTWGIALASFRIRHWTFTRWSATDGDRGHNWADPSPLKWWSRDFPVEWTRETFSTPDKPNPRQTRTWPRGYTVFEGGECCPPDCLL